MNNNNKLPKIFWIIISSFLIIPIIVSFVSTIHVIDFFELSNHKGLAITLAIAFEVGALSALAGLVALDKINKNVVWLIFFILTAYQMMGNIYAAYNFINIEMLHNPNLIKNWIELFGFSYDPEDLPFAKRMIAIISGAILPIVSLSFLDLSVDYIQKSTGIKLNRPVGTNKEETIEEKIIENTFPEVKIQEELPENLEKKTEVEIQPILEEKNKDNETITPFVEEDTIDELSKVIDDKEFEKVISNKKKKLENLRGPYLTLLLLLYKGGEVIKGDELYDYNDFLNIVPKDFTESQIKGFLTLCNYLNIFKISCTHKIALKSYGEAIEALNNYLQWN